MNRLEKDGFNISQCAREALVNLKDIPSSSAQKLELVLVNGSDFGPVASLPEFFQKAFANGLGLCPQSLLYEGGKFGPIDRNTFVATDSVNEGKSVNIFFFADYTESGKTLNMMEYDGGRSKFDCIEEVRYATSPVYVFVKKY